MEPARPFPIRRINHVALVCRDMDETVAFYEGVLGMPLVKTHDIPGGGQHYFFDVGDGSCVAFFWFADSPPPAPGIAGAAAWPGRGDMHSAIGSMNHLAFDVPLDSLRDCRARLKERGIPCSVVVQHADNDAGYSLEMTDDVFICSLYFFDPNGVLLEFAAWARTLTEADIERQEPVPQ